MDSANLLNQNMNDQVRITTAESNQNQNMDNSFRQKQNYNLPALYNNNNK